MYTVYKKTKAYLNFFSNYEIGLLKSSTVDGKELLSQDTSNSASCRLPSNDNKVKCFNAGRIVVCKLERKR